MGGLCPLRYIYVKFLVREVIFLFSSLLVVFLSDPDSLKWCHRQLCVMCGLFVTEKNRPELCFYYIVCLSAVCERVYTATVAANLLLNSDSFLVKCVIFICADRLKVGVVSVI